MTTNDIPSARDASAGGKAALVICTEFGVEEPELKGPVDALREAGVDVTIASTGGDTIQTVTGDKDWASTVPADRSLTDVNADDFDVLVIPGGTVNADTLRGNDDARKVLRDFADARKPVAAICHGPWILIDAGLAEGKTLTSYSSVAIDLTNAGANWVDKSVFRCTANDWTLITSRNPGDLDDFQQAILDELKA